MPEALLETKLLQPRSRRHALRRSRLETLLSRAESAPVTLVSAPAGFGKTTLLSTWATSEERPVAWVSLDRRDQQPGSFWTYVLAGLDRAVPGTCAGALTLLRSGQAAIESVLADVVNELSVYDGEVSLVLDDYHLADGPEIAAGMVFLIEHLPPQLHLVVSTRADPGLPLARLRARGELVEIRSFDLRLNQKETAAYLNHLHALDLPADAVATLEARTEGWVAALQLAALSLRDREDPSQFINRFAGDDRFILDYLADEVLDRQPEHVRRFLLDTAVLERLNGSLVEAVHLGSPRSGRAMLDLLDRGNLFVVPLDGNRRWYRYHHLFADVLRAHLLEERPDEVAELHRRASRWFAEIGEAEDAVRHALAARDSAMAAELAELALPALRRDRRESLVRRWVDELPPEVVRDRPVLAIGLIGALMASNDFGPVEGRLRELEQMLTRPTSELVVVDHREFAPVLARTEMYRAGLALIAGDRDEAIAHAQRAITAAPADDELTVASASALSGLASWADGDIIAAHKAYVASARGLERTGHIADLLGCSLAIADMELALGRLRDSERTLNQALTLGERTAADGSSVLRGTADMLVALSRAAWHRDDLPAAADLLRRADDLGEAAGLPQHPYRWRVAMARLRAIEHDWGAALDLLDDAERLYVGDFSPQVHPIHATRARIHVASGDVARATTWAREHNLGINDDLSYLREYEHVTLARILIADHNTSGSADALRDAMVLLDRLLAAASDGGRAGTVIEVETLRAVAHRAAHDDVTALQALQHAIDLAEPEGWVRFLGDAAVALTGLLRTLAQRRPSSDYVNRLLAGSGERAKPTPPMPLLDPLSERELDVLRLLRSDLDGPGIAREMVVSLNTVRTHTKHIYTKLGVTNRRAAVSKAAQLGILARAPGS